MASCRSVDITNTSCEFLMAYAFNRRVSFVNESLQNENMAELTPELYKELLRYSFQQNSYFTQPIDLSNYREGKYNKAA